MSRRIAFPLFGSAEARYNQYQEMQKQQSYNLLVRALKSVGEERAFQLVITNIQQGDKGLEPGTLFCRWKQSIYISIRPSFSCWRINDI